MIKLVTFSFSLVVFKLLCKEIKTYSGEVNKSLKIKITIYIISTVIQ